MMTIPSWRRRVAIIAPITAVVALSLAISAQALHEPNGTHPNDPAVVSATDKRELKWVGDEVFWEGVVIESARVLNDSLCDVVDPCYEYELAVSPSPRGSRLRIGFTAVLPEVGSVRPWADTLADSPEMKFEIQLYEPGTAPSTHEPVDSKEAGPVLVDEMDGLHGYSAEFEVGGIDADGSALAAPTGGTWTLRVVPVSVIDMGFRMRATLEDATAYPSGLQYPDLRLNPPFEPNFATVPATLQPGVTAERGGPHASCMPEEGVEAAQFTYPLPQLCLRFSMGLENVGVGTFELIWQRPADEAEAAAQLAGAAPRPQLQRVCDFLGQNCKFRPDRGIQTIFHRFHAHEHWAESWSIRLFKVPEEWKRHGPEPRLEDGPGPFRKLGILPSPELLADWDRFWLGARPPVTAENSGCFADGGGPCGGALRIALPPGWADIYEYNRGGNYVEFPQGLPLTPEPGVYVLKGKIDPDDLIEESNEGNNLSYALVKVQSDGHVDLLERGYGSSPWDKQKTVSTVSP